MKMVEFNSLRTFFWALIPGILICGCISFDVPEADTESGEVSTETGDVTPTDDDSNTGATTETGEDTTTDTSHSTSDTGETDDSSDSHTGTDTSAPTDIDTPSDTLTDSNTEEPIDTHSDTDSDIPTDTPADTESDSDTDSATRVDTGSENETDTEIPITIDTDSIENAGGFDSRPTVVPTLSDTGGAGNVAAIGELSDPTPSSGGACNYGSTQIYNYAAINTHHEAGDELGQWADGRICGQCAQVVVETSAGITTTIVRIVDKCADDLCGILIGAQSAAEVMNGLPGKYWGAWRFVPCNGDERVSDGPPTIYIKEGSSSWWSYIQIRNAPAAVQSILWESGNKSGEFEFSTETQNFYVVPVAVLQTSQTVTLILNFDFDITIVHELKGTELAQEDTQIVLTAPEP